MVSMFRTVGLYSARLQENRVEYTVRNVQTKPALFERTHTHKRFTYGCTSKFTIFIHSFFLFLHTMQSFEQYLWSSFDTLTTTTKRTCTCLCIHLFENHVYIFWFHRPYVILSSGYLFNWSLRCGSVCLPLLSVTAFSCAIENWNHCLKTVDTIGNYSKQCLA